MPAHDSDDNMRAFVETYDLQGMVQVVDDDGAIWRRYGIAYQPAWVFIGPEGDLDVVAGALHGDRLFARLEEMTAG